MALVIASNLRKELAGDVLFDGVSFKVERRDRVALSGPNGAGKTTLLRILVEPTNHLDVASIEWLERELASLDAGVILVAHDRWFLEAVTGAVLELESGRSTFFPGPWHTWRGGEGPRAPPAGKAGGRHEGGNAPP